MIYIKYLSISILMLFFGLAYNKYNTMESTIESQRKDIENKEMTISIMAGNIDVMKEQFMDDIAKKVFEATAKERKKSIEERLNYDNNKSVDTNSTRIYL